MTKIEWKNTRSVLEHIEDVPNPNASAKSDVGPIGRVILRGVIDSGNIQLEADFSTNWDEPKPEAQLAVKVAQLTMTVDADAALNAVEAVQESLLLIARGQLERAWSAFRAKITS